jgi:oxygen-dependent protoporphyrinogen oxidase
MNAPATPRVVVIGGGIAGLATAHALLARRPDLDVLVLESAARPGGNVRTLRRDGCTVELGPDAFVTRPGHAEALCQSLGIEGTLVAPDPRASRVMVARRNALHPLPDGMAMGMPRSVRQLATTALLSPLGKARAVMDLVLPERSERDASVGALVAHRLGREVKDHLVEPVVGGIYGGDVDELEAAVVMPSLAEVRGSLIRALARAPRPPGASPRRAPAGGLVGLVDALAHAIGRERVLTDVAARAVSRRPEGGWRVVLDGGVRLDADEVVLATPPGAAGRLIAHAAPELAEHLERIRLRPALTAVMAFARGEVAAPRASGALIPRDTPDPLGALSALTFVDHKWPGRVADHLSLVRAAFRPSVAAEWLGRDDDAVVAQALAGLRALLDVPEPRWAEVERFSIGTPYPEVGHLRRTAECRARAASLGGMTVVGAGVDGPGIAGCVRGATEAAEAITARLA